jgi:hypothetical protein
MKMESVSSKRADREPIVVEKQEFRRDPLPWFRKAGPRQRVIVRDADGKVAMVIGGTLDVRPL